MVSLAHPDVLVIFIGGKHIFLGVWLLGLAGLCVVQVVGTRVEEAVLDVDVPWHAKPARSHSHLVLPPGPARTVLER